MDALTERDELFAVSLSSSPSSSCFSTPLSRCFAFTSSSSLAPSSPSHSPYCLRVDSSAAQKSCRMRQLHRLHERQGQPPNHQQQQPPGHHTRQSDRQKQQQQQDQSHRQQQGQQHQRQQRQQPPQQLLHCFQEERGHVVKKRSFQMLCLAAVVMTILACVERSSTVEYTSHLLSFTAHPAEAADVSSAMPAASSVYRMQSSVQAEQQQEPGDELSFVWSSTTAERDGRLPAAPSSFLPPGGQAHPRRLQAGVYYSDQDRARKGQFYLWLSVALVAILVLAIVYTLKIADVFDPLLHTRFTPSDRTR